MSAVLIVVLVLVGLSENGYVQTASVFQCQPTTDQSGRVFTPNIPDLYFNHTNAAAFRTGDGANLTTVTEISRTIFVYTTPPESACSGIVTAIQYCYHTTININITMPKLSFLRFLSLSRDGFNFTVSEKRTGEANGVCSDYPGSDGQRVRVCCGKKNLATNNRQFRIPSNYTFGVILLRNDIQPLAFSGTADMKYQFPHFVRRLSTSTPTSLTLNEDDYQSDRYLLLMRLLLDPDEPVTTDLVTTDPVTTNPVTADHVTMCTDTVTTDHDPVATKPRTGTTASELRNTSTFGAGISDCTSISTVGSESNLNGGGGGGEGVVGGAVSGVVAAILVVGVAIALVVFVMRRSKRNNPAATNDGISKSVHSLNSPHQENNTAGCVESEGVRMTDFPTVTNECYSTSRLPLPSRGVYQQQDMQLTQNQAYVTSANVSMKPNESYGTTTPSMDSDLLYATVEGEHNTTHTSQHDTTMTSHTSQRSKEEDYDYVIQIL